MHSKAMVPLKGFRDEKKKNKKQIQDFRRVMGKNRGGEKTGPNPTDRAKKGVKRSLLTEASGVPIGLAIDGANRHDSKMAEATI